MSSGERSHLFEGGGIDALPRAVAQHVRPSNDLALLAIAAGLSKSPRTATIVPIVASLSCNHITGMV